MEGWPVCGSRTWQWQMAAPALPDSMAASAIWRGVTGTLSLLATVSPPPVTAQVTMTGRDMASLRGKAARRP